MEDPLKPKAVPLSAGTVYWFEFLLDPHLITKHLRQQNPDPSPVDLLSQFISTTPDLQTTQFEITTPDAEALPGSVPVTPGTNLPTTQNISSNTDGLKISRKQLGIKILALKVGTFLKWNLDVLEKNLPIIKQMLLIRDLCTISFGKIFPIPINPEFPLQISSDGNEHAARFALTFYHRWVLRLQLPKNFSTKIMRPPIGNIFLTLDPMHQNIPPDIPPQKSIEFLQELCKSTEPFHIFTYDTFTTLNPYMESPVQNFELMKKIPITELRAQIYFDFVNYYLFTKQYQLAREAVIECRQNLFDTKAEYQRIFPTCHDFLYCHVSDEELEGYLLACGLSAKKVTLLERLNLSALTQYKDIIEILELDNIFCEIPLVNRRILELDIEGQISQGILKETRDLEMHVAALNVVRSIFEVGNIFASVEYFEKYNQMNCCQKFFQCINNVYPHCSTEQREAIKAALIDLILKETNGKDLLLLLQKSVILSQIELDQLQEYIKEQLPKIPSMATTNEWQFQSNLTRIEIGSIERQLIVCTNANAVRKLLVKLAHLNPTKPLWTANPSWEIATPIKSVLMSMQRGFLQDFAYVLLGKAREMTAKGDYIGAVSMLSVLKSETQRPELSSATIVMKLSKLISWEILLIQITQSLDEWNIKALDLQLLGNRCKQCLNSLMNGDSVIPRIEIVEMSALMLLNLGDWNSVMFLDKRLPQFELIIAFAGIGLDLETGKQPKKSTRDAWDIVLSMFVNASKRGATGGVNARSSPSLAISTSLQPFLKKLRHQLLFSLTTSLLGKIHNLLKDDVNQDVNGEYMQLWPTNISNPISYSIRSVSETLHWLLTEALKYYPQTVAWLKMKGDLELTIGNNEAAMRCYVNALITGTDYCSLMIQRTIADDYTIRKMIRCSSNLGCHMQATILCQFMDEIDYGLVFKNLSEKSYNFTDAMDAYYSCIWDTTLLEFIINLHAKKGEHRRKNEAIAIMGIPELNANNNEEIKREAAALRKANFLRALAKQYLL